MASPLDPGLIAQHRAKLQVMETEYLLGAWQIGTAKEWTPEGLEAIRRLLLDRLGYVPPRVADANAQSSSVADTYHDHDSVLKWALRLEGASWLPLVLAVLALISLIPEVFNFFQDVVLGGGNFQVEFGLNLLIPAGIAVTSLSLFLLLRAASHALLILLDIEDNTRAEQHGATADSTAPPSFREAD
jgi:hypothetical protein